MMNEILPEDVRRAAYGLVLSIYGTFEAIKDKGVLPRDIESHANWFLSLVARYQNARDIDLAIKDISGEIKAMRALVGIARDTNIIDRSSAMSLIEKCILVESLFETLIKDRISIRQNKGHDNAPYEKADVSYREKPLEQMSHTNEKRGEERSLLRQKAILEVIKRRNQVTIGELGLLFSGRVSKKTLQRDIQGLVDQKIVLRRGDRRWTYYELPSQIQKISLD